MTAVSSEQEAHRSHSAQLLGVEDGAALVDLEAGVGPLQLVAVAADELPRRLLVAAVAEDREIGPDPNQLAPDTGDAHIGDHSPRMRRRELAVAVWVPLPAGE